MLDEQPDRQDFLITFEGPGVVDGTLPDGSYRLIARHDRVNVLSGSPMTQNDVNRFVSRSAGVHGGKKDIGTTDKRSKGHLYPPRKAPAVFRGRTVLRDGAIHLATSRQASSGTIGVKAEDHRSAADIGVPAPGKVRPR